MSHAECSWIPVTRDWFLFAGPRIDVNVVISQGLKKTQPLSSIPDQFNSFHIVIDLMACSSGTWSPSPSTDTPREGSLPAHRSRLGS